jgi:hypothetical protein
MKPVTAFLACAVVLGAFTALAVSPVASVVRLDDTATSITAPANAGPLVVCSVKLTSGTEGHTHTVATDETTPTTVWNTVVGSTPNPAPEAVWFAIPKTGLYYTTTDTTATLTLYCRSPR